MLDGIFGNLGKHGGNKRNNTLLLGYYALSDSDSMQQLR